ncbi:NUDIX domain-containing protein [Candidatus Woesearchaeota archaeon]|nr:NUDIX domain-containing protein [Candidatus Woesearchaeota archaeon]
MQKKNISVKHIPAQLYRKIVAMMPICCVDGILKSGKNVYLFKRSRAPAKNQWWAVGGRIFKWETFKEAMLRKAKEEIGIKVKITKQIGTYEAFFGTGYFESSGQKTKKGAHTISVCFVIEPEYRMFRLKPNDEYSAYKRISKVENNFNPYIKRLLNDSGVFK